MDILINEICNFMHIMINIAGPVLIGAVCYGMLMELKNANKR